LLETFKKNFSQPEGMYGAIAGKIMDWENKMTEKWFSLSMSPLFLKGHNEIR
jgi:hypothetical protein